MFNGRVSEIRELTNEDHWYFCPGELNAADLPSRGFLTTALAENQMWLHGPEFLKYSRDQWPKCHALSETVKVSPTVTHSLATDVSSAHARIGLLMHCSKYGEFTRLLRVTALVLRFIKKLKGQKTHGDCLQIGASDLREAEMLWIKEVQMTLSP